MKGIFKPIAGIATAAMGIFGLAMTICGAYFTVASLVLHGIGYEGIVLIVSVATFLLGALMVWATCRLLIRWSKSAIAKTAASPPADGGGQSID